MSDEGCDEAQRCSREEEEVVGMEITGPTLRLELRDRLLRGHLGAHGLSAGQGVQRPGVVGSRGALEPGAARRRVDPAHLPALKRAGDAASAAGLPHHLRASGRHRGARAQPLLGARRAAERLGPQHGGPQRDRSERRAAQRRRHDAPQT